MDAKKGMLWSKHAGVHIVRCGPQALPISVGGAVFEPRREVRGHVGYDS